MPKNTTYFTLLYLYCLELLQNGTLGIINYESMNECDYCGKEIVDRTKMQYKAYNWDNDDLENIAEKSVSILLQNGAVPFVYKVVEDSSIFLYDTFSTFPVVYCTALMEVFQALRNTTSLLEDYACSCDEENPFDVEAYIRDSMTVYKYELKDGEVVCNKIILL